MKPNDGGLSNKISVLSVLSVVHSSVPISRVLIQPACRNPQSAIRNHFISPSVSSTRSTSSDS